MQLLKPVFFTILCQAMVICGTTAQTTKVPPNGVLLEPGLYMDATEITNIDYREYLAWIKQVVGENSRMYQMAVPDTTVWDTMTVHGNLLRETYFSHPMYETYPVVGISQTQAAAYAQWRTDRVYERALVLAGKIGIHPPEKPDSTEYFTVERYQNGQYRNYTQPDTTILVAHFRLPSRAVWEKAAAGPHPAMAAPYGYDFKKKSHQKALKKYGLGHCLVAGQPHQKTPLSTRSGLKNASGLWCMVGNVSEIVAEKGIAKGCYINQSVETCDLYKDITYEKPAHWLGFRCVSSWEKPTQWKRQR